MSPISFSTRFHLSTGLLRGISLSLACLLGFQGPAPAMELQVAQEPKLRIVILEGEGAINNIKKRTAREPVVQVVDENDDPVSGAMVMFTLPDTGPSGLFANSSKSLIAYTDAKGQALAKGLKPNKIEGQFQIRVDASFHGLSTQAAVSQTNALVKVTAAGISGKMITILAIAGAAAAAGIVFSDGEPPPAVPTPTTITVGTPNVRPPQ